jgi:hypothetical protein
MAASTIPAPGTDLGPCIDEQCGHTDCAASRQQAAALCRWCAKPIGYETRWYTVVGGQAHAECEERCQRERWD